MVTRQEFIPIRHKVFLKIGMHSALTNNDGRLIILLISLVNYSYEVSISPKEIALHLDIHISTARKCIQRLINEQVILKVESNRYKLNPFYGWGNPPTQKELTEYGIEPDPAIKNSLLADN